METKTRIASLTGISELVYEQEMRRMGYNYAWHYTEEDEWSVRYLTRTSSYWAWWQREFEAIDREFVAEYQHYADTATKTILRTYWSAAHHIVEVEAKIPESAFREMYQIMKEANKEQLKELKNKKKKACYQ